MLCYIQVNLNFGVTSTGTQCVRYLFNTESYCLCVKQLCTNADIALLSEM